jgi:ketosteroid isomerase-like protein
VTRVLRRAALVGTMALAVGASGCSLWPWGAESAAAGPAAPGTTKPERSGLAHEADQLLEADQAFAAKALAAGAPEAFREFLDQNGIRLTAAGEPVTGPDAVRASLAAGPATILTWEPRFAEVFAPGDWGWTWGDWQAHEQGAGGRRVAEGRYASVWKKQKDGKWRVRMDLRN